MLRLDCDLKMRTKLFIGLNYLQPHYMVVEVNHRASVPSVLQLSEEAICVFLTKLEVVTTATVAGPGTIASSNVVSAF